MNCLLCNRQLSYHLTFKDLLWPQEIERPVVCATCADRFTPLPTTQVCPGCNRRQDDDSLCVECKVWQAKYGWHLTHRALFAYDEAFKEFMHQYKFNGDYRLRAVFASLFSRAIREQTAEVVVPIPVTTETMQTRGFNQVVGLTTGIKLTSVLAHRVASKVAQSQKNRQERLQTPQPFVLTDPTLVLDKKVLVIDDIYTTGGTIYHAATLVREAGAKAVCSLSLAH